MMVLAPRRSVFPDSDCLDAIATMHEQNKVMELHERLNFESLTLFTRHWQTLLPAGPDFPTARPCRS